MELDLLKYSVLFNGVIQWFNLFSCDFLQLIPTFFFPGKNAIILTGGANQWAGWWLMYNFFMTNLSFGGKIHLITHFSSCKL